MSDEGELREDSHPPRYVRKRIRIEPPRLTLRERAKLTWKHNQRWMVPIAILVVGCVIAWLMFGFRTRE